MHFLIFSMPEDFNVLYNYKVFKEFQACVSCEDAFLRCFTKIVLFLCIYPHCFVCWCFSFIYEYISVFYSEVVWDTCPLRGLTGVFPSPVDIFGFGFQGHEDDW